MKSGSRLSASRPVRGRNHFERTAFFLRLVSNLYVYNLQFKAAELGMFIFPKLVGKMKDAAFLQTERPHGLGLVPAHSREHAGPRSLGQLQTDMLFLEIARRGCEPDVVRRKDRLLIAQPKRLHAANPGKECRGNSVQRQQGMDRDLRCECGFRQTCLCKRIQALPEFRRSEERRVGKE